jgi:hypothetical protein
VLGLVEVAGILVTGLMAGEVERVLEVLDLEGVLEVLDLVTTDGARTGAVVPEAFELDAVGRKEDELVEVEVLFTVDVEVVTLTGLKVEEALDGLIVDRVIVVLGLGGTELVARGVDEDNLRVETTDEDLLVVVAATELDEEILAGLLLDEDVDFELTGLDDVDGTTMELSFDEDELGTGLVEMELDEELEAGLLVLAIVEDDLTGVPTTTVLVEIVGLLDVELVATGSELEVLAACTPFPKISIFQSPPQLLEGSPLHLTSQPVVGANIAAVPHQHSVFSTPAYG